MLSVEGQRTQFRANLHPAAASGECRRALPYPIVLNWLVTARYTHLRDDFLAETVRLLRREAQEDLGKLGSQQDRNAGPERVAKGYSISD